MRFDSRLQKSRHGIYYFRIQIDGLDRRWSLRTRDPIVAKIAAFEFSARLLIMKNDFTRPHLGWVLEASGNDIKITTQDNDADRKSATEALAIVLKNPAAVIPVASVSISSAARTITLSAALDEYKPDLFKSKITEKTKRQAMSVLEGLRQLLGSNFDMMNLNDEIIEDRWLPNRLKTVVETTAKRDLSHIRSFVNWAAHRARKYVPTQLTFSINAKGEHYEYFELNDLELIFDNLPKFAQNSWQFWIPLVGLYTGARIGEIASLKVDYFEIKNGINAMYINGTKTISSPRTLPLHSVLIELGLLEYVEHRRKINKVTLFDLKNSESNGLAEEPSGWFSEYRKTIGILEKMKVFHSFRHTIIDLMNQLSINDKASAQYTGHSSAHNIRNSTYGRKSLALNIMKIEVVDKIDFNHYCGLKLDINSLAVKAKEFI